MMKTIITGLLLITSLLVFAKGGGGGAGHSSSCGHSSESCSHSESGGTHESTMSPHESEGVTAHPYDVHLSTTGYYYCIVHNGVVVDTVKAESVESLRNKMHPFYSSAEAFGYLICGILILFLLGIIILVLTG